jgi:hypothetical protein
MVPIELQKNNSSKNIPKKCMHHNIWTFGELIIFAKASNAHC